MVAWFSNSLQPTEETCNSIETIIFARLGNSSAVHNGATTLN